MIDNKLQFYQTRAGYDAQAEAGNIPNDALVFVKETHEIITHGEEDFGNSDKYGDIAYLGDQAGTAVTPEFNPQDDTVWTKDQVLSDDKKDAAQANILNKVAGDGMGKVVLKRNIVSGVNTLTQDMFYKTEGNTRVPNTDTIFVIKYDFTLTGDVTIPANCVLQFDGGSISGAHTIICNNSYIKGISPKSNFIIDGTFNYETIDSFGVSPINTGSDNTLHFESFNANNVSCIKFGKGVYNFNSPINIKDNVSIKGDSQNSTKLIFPNDGIIFGPTQTTWYNKVNVKDLYIKSNNGNCIDLANTNNASMNNALFTELCLEAPNGSCFYQTYRGQHTYSNTFFKVTFINSLYAFNHCSLILNTLVQACIDLGVTIYFKNIICEGEGLVCRDLAVGCNHTVKHFIFINDSYEAGDSASSKIIIENCSFEELTSNYIVCCITTIESTNYYITMKNCNFNTATFNPQTNYVFNNGFSEVAYDTPDNYYPFVGYNLIPMWNNCAISFRETRNHKVYAIIGEVPYYGVPGPMNMAIAMRYYGALRYTGDFEFFDINDIPSGVVPNLVEFGYIKRNRKCIILNNNSNSRVFYISSLGINLRKEDYIEVIIKDNSYSDVIIHTTSDYNLISDNHPSAGVQIHYRDTGTIKTYNGTNWVYPDGTQA